MKKLFARLRFWRPWRPRRLLALCYAAFLAGSLLACSVSLAADRLLRAAGQLKEQRLEVEDFTLIEMERGGAENLWISTSSDPRMILKDCPARVSGVELELEYLDLDPGEFTLFYQPRPGMEEFDAGYRLWARRTGEGSWAFTLPAGRIYGLRLDPAIYTGVQMQIDSIVLNRRQPAAEFFAPSRPWAAAGLVCPALAAAAVDTARAVLCASRAPGRPGKKKE